MLGSFREYASSSHEVTACSTAFLNAHGRKPGIEPPIAGVNISCFESRLVVLTGLSSQQGASTAKRYLLICNSNMIPSYHLQTFCCTSIDRGAAPLAITYDLGQFALGIGF